MIKDVKWLGEDVRKVMVYGTLLWERPKYFRTRMLAEGSITLTIKVTTARCEYISYSLDGVTWVRTDNEDEEDVVITTPTLAAGRNVYWKGIGTKLSTTTSNYSNFTSTANFSVGGNIMSLLYGDEFEDKTTIPDTYAFLGLFRGNTKLISSADLELPATTLTNYCYAYMFYGCSNMTETVPILPATTIVERCYSSMYQSCSKLTTAPVLPAETLATQCYYYTFRSCSRLTYVKCLATDISATGCLTNWLYSVGSTGTFVQAAGVTWPSGGSGIPDNWTIETESTT